jgi:hypothetical protein
VSLTDNPVTRAGAYLLLATIKACRRVRDVVASGGKTDRALISRFGHDLMKIPRMRQDAHIARMVDFLCGVVGMVAAANINHKR